MRFSKTGFITITFLLISNIHAQNFSTNVTPYLQNSKAVQNELRREDAPNSAKYKFIFSTEADPTSQRSFLCFLRTQLENGEELDSEYVLLSVKNSSESLAVKTLFRDTSIYGIRYARGFFKARLSNEELRIIYKAFAKYELTLMSKEEFREYAFSLLDENKNSQDKQDQEHFKNLNWVFEQILGPYWQKK